MNFKTRHSGAGFFVLWQGSRTDNRKSASPGGPSATPENSVKSQSTWQKHLKQQPAQTQANHIILLNSVFQEDFTVVIRWHFCLWSQQRHRTQSNCAKTGFQAFLPSKKGPCKWGEGRTGPPHLLPARTNHPVRSTVHAALSWTPNSLILINHATPAIWHLLCLSNRKWKRNIYDQKQPFNSLLLPRFWFFFLCPFFLLITVPPCFTLPAAILQEIPRKKF